MAGMQGADPSPPSLRPEGHSLGDGRRGWGLHQACRLAEQSAEIHFFF